MTLFAIAHDQRLASPSEGARFFRALGEKRVSARGFHTEDPARIEALVAAVDTRGDHTVSFEGGVLDAATFAAVSALALSRLQYLDVASRRANLRVWPALYSWVHADDRAVAERLLGRSLGEGRHEFEHGEIVVPAEGKGYPVTVETTSIPAALRWFAALAGDQLRQGFVSGLTAEAKPHLAALLRGSRTRAHAVLEVEVEVAEGLTELYAGEKLDWQASGVLLDFPEGRIHGFLRTPDTGPKVAAKWQAPITKALQKAGLAR